MQVSRKAASPRPQGSWAAGARKTLWGLHELCGVFSVTKRSPKAGGSSGE